ncbi:hypothetical protein [Pseudanabaena sp. ABRG5-3]|uniref:hypothetical protein n=1 Tax=Pseudanabaena sp. ABRG5-3 TaxID=685565 RepID=UPI000DC714E8|nr:hypothetical protein [Pseudanabaena sp. ABRG5-3]BBC23629.1 bifunctional ornithine acetyltransferase/N-acetylglutamate synthase protein [Pseudanabaena sp. ABRG5-3]
MSFSEEQLKQHCEIILKDRKIFNKILVLCEGNIPKEQGRRSPQSYQKMERVPDANFYRACTPKNWMTNTPVFFVCGNCNNAISTYIALQEMLKEDKEEMPKREIKQLKYYHPKQIFVFIDLDNQVRKINDYHLNTTQEIFFSLYEKTKINLLNTETQHSIIVTGLIHKEAYFLIPELQEEVFDKYKIQSFYKDSKLSLEEIYLAMSKEIDQDKNLASNLEIIRPRIKNCIDLDFDTIEQFKNSWISQFQNETNDHRRREFILSLLTILNVTAY